MNKRLISIDISMGSYSEFIDKWLAMAQSKQSTYTCVANVHMLVEAHNDPEFAATVNSADIVTPDGMPLTWGLRLVHNIKQERVAGMDLLPDLLKQAELKEIPVFFYGGTQAMLDQTKLFLIQKFPSLNVAGMISPPFRNLSDQEEREVIEKINNSGAQLVFVALGCPKQEKWMASMKGRVQATMIGIGGALPVMVGIQKRAPEWMQKASLEWLYRLFQEPGRLFKRYAVTNTTYLLLLMRVVLSPKPIKTAQVL
ncbi:MAG: WecB/TagA/CpsF family glycosyltransferase [Siphonobacter sp.]